LDVHLQGSVVTYFTVGGIFVI